MGKTHYDWQTKGCYQLDSMFILRTACFCTLHYLRSQKSSPLSYITTVFVIKDYILFNFVIHLILLFFIETARECGNNFGSRIIHRCNSKDHQSRAVDVSCEFPLWASHTETRAYQLRWPIAVHRARRFVFIWIGEMPKAFPSSLNLNFSTKFRVYFKYRTTDAGQHGHSHRP